MDAKLSILDIVHKPLHSLESVKLEIVRKYTTELIPVKSYNKHRVFLVGMTFKDSRNYSIKLQPLP